MFRRQFGGVTNRPVAAQAGRGNENIFASEADICEKFEKPAIKALPKAQAQELDDAVLNLESLKYASEIAGPMQKQ